MDETSSSRQARIAEATRHAILDAFLALAHETNAVTVSVPAVAARAGVSVRTVYRYFPSKDDLQTAAAYRMATQALGDHDIDQTTIDDLDAALESMWGLFHERLPALHAEHSTPAGRELRSTRLPDARERMRRQADVALDDDTVDMLVALTSSSMFLELVDRMGHSPARAAAMVTRTCRTILTASAQQDPTAQNPDPTDHAGNSSDA